jgi:hypothetical protein
MEIAFSNIKINIFNWYELKKFMAKRKIWKHNSGHPFCDHLFYRRSHCEEERIIYFLKYEEGKYVNIATQTTACIASSLHCLFPTPLESYPMDTFFPPTHKHRPDSGYFHLTSGRRQFAVDLES